MRKATSGFTIVELLVVIVVIAILAAITVVAYNGIQSRAIDTTVKADLANFAKRMELLKVDTADGGYLGALAAGSGISATKSAYATNRNNWYYCMAPDHQSYALGVVSTKSKGYYMSSVNGLHENQAVDSSQTCIQAGTVGGTPGVTILTGFNYATPPGAWSSWVTG
jgi:general secretion pathway protein G